MTTSKDQDISDPVLAALHDPKIRTKLMNFVKRMGIRDVEDVVQETYLKAFEHRDRFHSETNMEPLLYRIARFTAIDQIRKQSYRGKLTTHTPMIENIHPSRSPAADAILEAREGLAYVAKQMQRQPSSIQDGIEMTVRYTMENISIKDLQRTYDLSETTVRKRLSRSQKKAREIIEK